MLTFEAELFFADFCDGDSHDGSDEVPRHDDHIGEEDVGNTLRGGDFGRVEHDGVDGAELLDEGEEGTGDDEVGAGEEIFPGFHCVEGAGRRRIHFIIISFIFIFIS